MIAAPALPPSDDWRTTDQDEVNRRRARALEEAPRVENKDPRHPVFSNFTVHSPSGQAYSVEIREIEPRHASCDCVDFSVNGLGTCKHVEAVMTHLQGIDAAGSKRIDLVPDREAGSLRVERGVERLPAGLRRLFDSEGRLTSGVTPEMALAWWSRPEQPELRVSQEVAPWLEGRRRERESHHLRRTYEQQVQAGVWPLQETLLPLFPYQRQGMLHLACAERALLADEMGLGKTVQAIAACALLQRIGLAERALVVTPVSLRAEWEELIRRFTGASSGSVAGNRARRLAAYEREQAPFFTLVTYEQMLTDALEVNARLRPEIVILDEAQRIRNWNNKTALAVKRLRSRYAWVLTDAPLDERIDELYSLVSFLDPSVFGPLFRFNREFYHFDERGRPKGVRNLDQLRRRVRPLLLRRLRTEVATELPHQTERTYLVPMSEGQRLAYRRRETALQALLARRRSPVNLLQRAEQGVHALRMLCDTPYILDQTDRACPKAEELARILPQCLAAPGAKVVIYSEWQRMLELVSGVCRRLRVDFAWRTGKQPKETKRAETQRFREDPACRILLCTNAADSRFNLPEGSVVIHCDQPWNPNRRLWGPRGRSLTVLRLVSENTIEQRLHAAREIGAADSKDRLARIRGLMSVAKPKDDDPAKRFCEGAAELLQGALVSCEERFPDQGDISVLMVVVESDALHWREQLRPLESACLPPPLEVLDRPAADLLRRLAESGVIRTSIRASRQLYPASDEEQERTRAHELFAGLKAKLAKVKTP
jgi:superfamily II DNA or RNA helicase